MSDKVLEYALWAMVEGNIDNPIAAKQAALTARAVHSDPELEAAFHKVYLGKRRRWLDYLTVTQRHWQQTTRNPNKARHRDSIAMRERYMRGGNRWVE